MNQKPRTKKYSLFLSSFTFYLFFLLFSCEKNKTPTEITPPQPEIKLSLAEAPRLREIRLKVEVSKVKLPQNFQLSRNDSIIMNGQMTTADSVLKDTDLTPATEYRYRVSLLQDGAITDTSNLLQTRTMDTTSHNYVWTIDTIGTIGSTLLDVFAISEDDVWAVGDVDTGANQSFNAMHWDGIEWTLKRILFEYTYGTGYSTARCVFALSHNNVIVSDGGSIMRWNGAYWNSVGLFDTGDTTVIRGALTKIWGTSFNSLYGVGNNGTTIYYNGSSWQKLESGTQLRLTDVWGFPDGVVYMTGSSSSTLDNVFLIYKDHQFQKIEDATRRKKGVWGTASDNLYLAGDGIFKYDGESLAFIQLPPDIPNYHMESIRGTAENNIFAVGHFGFVVHYNGSSWRYYPELYRYAIASSVAVMDNSVFVVGTDGSQAFIYHGRRIN